MSDFAEAQTQLAELKRRIRESHLSVRENYLDPEALGQWARGPVAGHRSNLPGRAAAGIPGRRGRRARSFRRSRAKIYIGRAEYAERLDAHAAGESPPLVILGESGMGKSALLANWAVAYRQHHPDELMLLHFIGASPYSADWAAMLRRILSEFNRRFDMKVKIPDKPDALRLTFANALHMAAAKRKSFLSSMRSTSWKTVMARPTCVAAARDSGQRAAHPLHAPESFPN